MSTANLNLDIKTDLTLIEKLKDPKYFIETFLWIINKELTVVPFLLNPPQQKYLEERTHNDLILKARKEGFSSLIQALWLHACIFQKNVRAVILSHELESTMRHFNVVRWTLANMGYEGAKFVVDLEKDNQKQLSFPQTNSSFWIGTAGARAFGRGDDISHLHLSEVAHYQDQSILTGVLEACVPGAYKVMETTANGVGEMFNLLWQDSLSPEQESVWKPHFFSWHDDPTNVAPVPQEITVRLTDFETRLQKAYKLSLPQILWWRGKYKGIADKKLMPQEYPSNAREAFLASGRHCFDLEKIDSKLEAIKDILPTMRGDIEDDGAMIGFKSDPDGNLKIWKAPRHNRMYLIAGDSGKGVQGGDWSVADVYDRASWEQVAQWRGRPDPGVFGEVMTLMGRYYNQAILVPELNDQGWATVERIKANRYPHLLNTKELWNEKDGPHTDGFPQNEKTRNKILTALRNCIDEDTVYFNSEISLKEMTTFIQNEKSLKFEAQKGCHDDAVMTAAIAIFCLKFLTVDETYREDRRSIHSSPLITQVVGEGRRRSATGYR